MVSHLDDGTFESAQKNMSVDVVHVNSAYPTFTPQFLVLAPD